jgi:hypothetical protein
MSASMFFIKGRKGDVQLRDVASGVFSALSVSESEERESANYPPSGHYYAGYCENAEVTVYHGDDARTDYPFRVSVEHSSWREGRGIIPADAASVAKALAASGFTVLVPAGAWEQVDWDGDGDVYAP